MTEDAIQEINLIISMLKTAMQDNNVHFGLLIDKKDGNKSRIAFMDKAALEQGETKGFAISIDEMNRHE